MGRCPLWLSQSGRHRVLNAQGRARIPLLGCRCGRVSIEIPLRSPFPFSRLDVLHQVAIWQRNFKRIVSVLSSWAEPTGLRGVRVCSLETARLKPCLPVPFRGSHFSGHISAPIIVGVTLVSLQRSRPLPASGRGEQNQKLDWAHITFPERGPQCCVLGDEPRASKVGWAASLLISPPSLATSPAPR